MERLYVIEISAYNKNKSIRHGFDSEVSEQFGNSITRKNEEFICWYLKKSFQIDSRYHWALTETFKIYQILSAVGALCHGVMCRAFEG